MYPKSLKELINELMKLPSIGPKTAQRIAFYFIQTSLEECQKFSERLINLKIKLKKCKICFNFSENEICGICQNIRRDSKVICVVGDQRELVAIEKSREYNGIYHVLGGAISPLEGIGPENLHIKELLVRLNSEIKEVILATSPNVEGEATAIYLAKLIKPLGIKISRLAQGLPMGVDLEYADEVTLAKSLDGRREL
ncbi:MAG: recombination protein RecR [Armatimonadetes bacterium]|nr:recombination protein RecR [Armatimonadota bacterium]